MTAADVAREAADVILKQPSLRVLHQGILEGRRASGNMMKYLLMGTSSNFGNMFSMAAASVFLPFLPMLPTQILLNNFLYDLAQVTIPSDNVDEAYLRRPQRWDMRVIRDFMLLIGPISSIFDFLTFYALLRYFHASEPLVSHGMVRRVAGHADARALRHPDDGQSISESAQSVTDDHNARDRRYRRGTSSRSARAPREWLAAPAAGRVSRRPTSLSERRSVWARVGRPPGARVRPASQRGRTIANESA